jgi:hypothetical protein
LGNITPCESITMTPTERSALIGDIMKAFEEAAPTQLTPEEQKWVRMAIAKEAQSAAFRRAVIEKTVVGLVWVGMLWIGAAIISYFKQGLSS